MYAFRFCFFCFFQIVFGFQKSFILIAVIIMFWRQIYASLMFAAVFQMIVEKQKEYKIELNTASLWLSRVIFELKPVFGGRKNWKLWYSPAFAASMATTVARKMSTIAAFIASVICFIVISFRFK